MHRRSFELVPPHAPERVIRGRIETLGSADDPRPHVVIVHGFKGFMNWGFFPELSERIARAGWTAISFNMSGSGIGPDLLSFSDDAGFRTNSMARELDDLSCVAAYARSTDVPEAQDDRRALVGHSFGGGLSILHASETTDWNGLVTWASVATLDRFPERAKEVWRATGVLEIPNARTGQIHRIDLGWLEDLEANLAGRYDLVRAARAVEAPVHLLHARDDESVRIEESERLAAALTAGTLTAFETGGHTFGASHPLAEVPPVLERALDETLASLARCLG